MKKLLPDVVEKINKARNKAIDGGGVAKIGLQHQKGKLTARERIEFLLDRNSFNEFGIFLQHRCDNFGMEKQWCPGDGVVTGKGTIHGQDVCVYAQDFTVFGGSLGEVHAKKICNIMDIAAKSGMPIIGINDSGGARIQEGVDSLAGYGEIFKRNVAMSGVVPQISLIMGPCAGGAVYSPALTDFIFMVKKTSFMFITGPSVVKVTTSEDLTNDQLGGYKVHSEKSGVVDIVKDNEIEALLFLRNFMQFMPNNWKLKNKKIITKDPKDRLCPLLNQIIPNNPNQPYNVKEIISEVVDENYFLEIKEKFAKNIIIGFAHIDGNAVGIVANQPLSLAGCLDIPSSRKAARFIRFCDAFNIPIITFVDIPGFLPGKQQEHDGIICHGAKLVYAYAESTVPKITVILRKAYGGGYIAMNSKHLGADINFSWPNAEIAVMGPKSAVEVIFKSQITDGEKIKQLIVDYGNKFANPLIPAARGYIDDIIDPSETRMKIAQSLSLLQNKDEFRYSKKHDNLPL